MEESEANSEHAIQVRPVEGDKSLFNNTRLPYKFRIPQ